jgi:lysophospholipase L1-like esterase
VFVSGDSFTEGPGVQDGERFTDLLEGMFHSSDTSVSFINGGLSGTGPLKYGKLFLEVGVKYNPDALLICVFVNDIANTPENLSTKPFIAQTARPGLKEVAHALWPRLYSQLEFFYSQHEYRNQTKTSDFITTISKKARKRNIPQSQIKQWKESLPQELVNATNKGQFSGAILSKGLLYPEYWSDSIDISSKRAQNKWKSMTMILSEILNFAKKSEIETAVILIPSPFQYDPKLHSQTNPWIITGSEIRAEWLIEETEIQSRMRLWALSENVSFLDLTPAFREAAKSHRNLNYELDGHWNPWGHQVAANAIGSWLTERQIFSFMKK